MKSRKTSGSKGGAKKMHGGSATGWGSKPANTSRPSMGAGRAKKSDQGDMHTLGRMAAFSGRNEH